MQHSTAQRTAALPLYRRLEERRDGQGGGCVGCRAGLPQQQHAKHRAQQLPAAVLRLPGERRGVGDLVEHGGGAAFGAPRHKLGAFVGACVATLDQRGGSAMRAPPWHSGSLKRPLLLWHTQMRVRENIDECDTTAQQKLTVLTCLVLHDCSLVTLE